MSGGLLCVVVVAVAVGAAALLNASESLIAAVVVEFVAVSIVAVATLMMRSVLFPKDQGEDFDALVRNSSDIITVIGPDGSIRYLSPSLRHVLGHDPGHLVGRGLRELLHPDDWPRAFAAIADAATSPTDSSLIECRWLHQDGSWRHAEMTVANLLDDPKVERLVLNIRDVTERKILEEELVRQASHDALTNLPNRRLFRFRLEQALARGSRHTELVAVLIIDLDSFKEVNDSLGHGSGDDLLIKVAERLQECVRPEDTVARIGGDEFAILLESLSEQREVAQVADRILHALKLPVLVGEREVMVGASLGISVSDYTKGKAERLLREADLAMYAAKRKGTGGYRFFSRRLHASLIARRQLISDLQLAMQRDEFVLHYQPIVDLETGRVCELEALVRWQHPTRGLLPPSAFIEVAEQTGLVVPLGRWVLNHACRKLREYQEAFPFHSDLGIGVNVSGRQLLESVFEADVEAALRDSGVDPTALLLEITETVLVSDAETVINRLETLRGVGVRVAIDDFGTGYSSLSYLRRFPFDIVKIDRQFVEGVAHGGQDAAVARAIVTLSQDLGLEAVAEGIETTEQLMSIRSMGCKLGQGFLIARPADEERTASMLAVGSALFSAELAGDHQAAVQPRRPPGSAAAAP